MKTAKTAKPRIAFVMDPIHNLKAYKDTTVGMIAAAQNYADIHYITVNNLWLEQGVALCRAQALRLNNDQGDGQWFKLNEIENKPLTEFAWFPELCPSTLITRNMQDMIAFQEKHQSVVAKPLDGMGGKSIFVIHANDGNRQVVFETLTDHGKNFAMVQTYIPEITETGDQRVILINGEPAPYALARIPTQGEHRGNLAAGGKGIGVPLSDSAKRIADRVGPVLKERGVLFAGLDIIGDYMTEINVTSPTGIRELNDQFDLNLGEKYIQAILEQIS